MTAHRWHVSLGHAQSQRAPVASEGECADPRTTAQGMNRRCVFLLVSAAVCLVGLGTAATAVMKPATGKPGTKRGSIGASQLPGDPRGAIAVFGVCRCLVIAAYLLCVNTVCGIRLPEVGLLIGREVALSVLVILPLHLAFSASRSRSPLVLVMLPNLALVGLRGTRGGHGD